jgi:hypothetical protein
VTSGEGAPRPHDVATCRCATCTRARQRVVPEESRAELEAADTPVVHEEEPVTSGAPSNVAEDAAPVREVHHHHHHHSATKTETRRETQTKVVRQRPRRSRRTSVLRGTLVVVFLLWVMHSFYPNLDVPLVPGMVCSNGAVVATPGQTVPAGYTVEQAGLGGKVRDLIEQSLGTAVKKLTLLLVGSAIHAAGATVRAMAEHPPPAEDVRAGLLHDADTIGHVVGFVWAAFGGKSVSALTANAVPQEGVVATAAAAGTGGCGTCPSGAAVVPAAARATDTPDTAARAVLRAGTDWDPVTAVMIAGAESHWRHGVVNPLGDHNGNHASGLFQTMMPMHAALFGGSSWQDPYANAVVAHKLWQSRGWQPWVSSRPYWERYRAEAAAAVRRVQAAAPVAQPTVQPVADIHLKSAGSTFVDGKRVSVITARQLRLAEQISGIDLHVMQGGYGGDHILASGTSHNFPGTVDVSPGTIEVETLLRSVGFDAWARNIPGRSSAGSGAHVHGVSALDPGDASSPQVYGSWAHGGNGLGGTDPAPHVPWIPNLVARVGGVSLATTASTGCAPGPATAPGPGPAQPHVGMAR